jgi:hypothetical protein
LRETFGFGRRGLRNVSGIGLLGMFPTRRSLDYHYHMQHIFAGQASDFCLSQSARGEGVLWHTHQNNGCLIVWIFRTTQTTSVKNRSCANASNVQLWVIINTTRWQPLSIPRQSSGHHATFSRAGTSTPYAILQYSRVSRSSFQSDTLQIFFRVFQQETVSCVSNTSHTASAQSWVLTYTTRSLVRQYPSAIGHEHLAYPTKAGNRTTPDSLPI